MENVLGGLFSGRRRHAPCHWPLSPPPNTHLNSRRCIYRWCCLLSYSLRRTGVCVWLLLFRVLFLNIYMRVFRKIPPNILLLTQEPWQPLWLKKFSEHEREWRGCVWGDGGWTEWRSLGSHSSTNTMVYNGLLMFSWGWFLSSWWAVKWNAIS